MIEFFRNNGGTILVGAVLSAVIALIIVKLARDKRAGKNCCGCDNCCGCGGDCSLCAKSERKERRFESGE